MPSEPLPESGTHERHGKRLGRHADERGDRRKDGGKQFHRPACTEDPDRNEHRDEIWNDPDRNVEAIFCAFDEHLIHFHFLEESPAQKHQAGSSGMAKTEITLMMERKSSAIGSPPSLSLYRGKR